MEFTEILRYVAALLLVLALIGAAGLAARRFGLSGVPGLLKPAAERRLAIVESLMLSPRQRLFIVRRDEVEHLIISGPDGATVVETSIGSPAQKPSQKSIST